MALPITLARLESAIRTSWSAETAHTPATWSSAKPSDGQCWTTAYVVRHFLGDEIVIAEVLPLAKPILRHAWNRFPGGHDVDLTRDQFPDGQAFRECDIPESVILAVSGKQAEILLQRVQRLISL